MRIEIELPRDATDYKVIPIGKNGAIAFYEGRGNHVDSSSWVFVHYDTNLQKKQNFIVKTPANLNYTVATHDQENIYIFLSEKFQKKTTLSSYFLALNFLSGESDFTLIDGFHDENINFIEKVENHFILISTSQKGYTIYKYGIEGQKMKTITLCKEPIRTIEFCEVDTFLRCISWGMVLELSSNNTVMHYVTTDYYGNIIEKVPFPRYSGFSYMTARMAVIDSAESLILGTYVRDDEKGKTMLPTGIYTMRIRNNIPQEPDFFSDRQIKSKDSTHTAKPAKNAQNLQVVVGNIQRVNGNYALVTEMFYPEYEYSSYSYGYDPFYSGRQTTPTANFLGYRFMNATITAFDSNGELAWNHYMPFKNVLTLNLFPRISTFNFEENTVIYYIFNASLSYTMVDNSEVIEPVTTKNMVLSNSGEAVEYSRNVQMTNWYDNYFLISGYHYLKGKTRSTKGKRYVFYMNKMEYR